jgi:radical SAM protein (TIGR01212 family)
VEILQSAYDAIRAFPEIKALAIGTRPDCLDTPRLELIAGYAREYEVWLELGLQSIHDETLRQLNRGHDARAFFQAVDLVRQYPGINLCAHVILGLPGETPEHEAATARAIGSLRLEGVKLHPLYVVKGTALEKLYTQKQVALMSREEYVERAGSFLEYLWPETLIQRLSADCPPELLAGPAWLQAKSALIREIESWLQNQETWQGKKYLT